MSQSCSISGLTIPVSRFPLPREDLDETGLSESRIVLAGGCFWCVEAVFAALDGVLGVQSGYAGGPAESANYEAVCSGGTGHAEVVEVRYDPARTSLGKLLQVFFSVAHDPTQLNRQGNDVGPQYRSAVFYETPEQRAMVEAYIRQLEAEGVYGGRIVTTLEPLDGFYPAEDYHQRFAERNPHQPYIMAIAAPKMEKLGDSFPERIRHDDGGGNNPEIA
ncbi:MAG: peptide-methionine (S)-S-oxide reductase MsrA [Pseudomonadota bacterium]|nr:peptide-methionine (S)-S-oxide reductase MsrA [Pseudomonadota bacterium]